MLSWIRDVAGAVIFPAIILSATVFLPVTSSALDEVGSSNATPASRLFSSAVEKAGKGEIEEAVSLAIQARETDPGDITLGFRFVETIAVITDKADQRKVNKVLNEGIRAAGELRSMQICDGTQDPALGFGYMNSLSKLAESVRPHGESTAAQLMIAQGEVANNLVSNPYLNPEVRSYLGKPFYETAVGFAMAGDGEQAVNNLSRAIEIGFTQFDRINDEPAFEALTEAATIRQIAEAGRTNYLSKIDLWATNELASFQPFAFEFSAANVEGGQLQKEKFSGSITVIDLWATWCPPCREGIPHFIRLNNEFSADGVQVLGLSVDNVNDPQSALEDVKRVLKDEQVNYLCGMADQQIAAQIPGETRWPTTLFLDAQGNVRMVARGYHDYDQLSAVVKKLLQEQ